MTELEVLENRLLHAAIDFFDGDTRRINHLIKVHTFSRLIAYGEGLCGDALYSLCLSAIVHDTGIKPSEKKYGSASGKYQELEGPAAAEPLLDKVNIGGGLKERILFLIAHHHTYDAVDGLDYQILLEADFLVNAYEDELSENAVRNAEKNFFKTKSGIELLHSLYL